MLVEDPEHPLPPYLGAGLLQLLDWVIVPPPQLLLQLDQEPKLDQPPSTANTSGVNGKYRWQLDELGLITYFI